MILGVDVSRWNWPVPWHALKLGGVKFAGVRATIGSRGIDQRYQDHRARIEAVDILPIAYGLISPWKKGAEQARHLVEVAHAGALAGDVEPREGDPPASAERWREVVYEFACEASRLNQWPPLLYGSPSFLAWIGLPYDTAGCPLWVADWRGHLAPEVPRPWTRATIWQTGSAPAPDGPVIDWDRYEGTLEELRAEILFS